MAKTSHRIFAGFMAALFGLTAVAFSAFVVYDISQSRNTQKQDQEAAQAQTQQARCTDTAERPTLDAPEAFRPEGAVTELQVTDLEPGDGAEAKAGDCLVVKYYGTLASDGTMFDENFTQPTAFALPLGQGLVIPGWDEGLVGMKPNGLRRLVIPAAKAYGPQSPSEKIPANSDLVFVVKLLEIKQQ